MSKEILEIQENEEQALLDQYVLFIYIYNIIIMSF